MKHTLAQADYSRASYDGSYRTYRQIKAGPPLPAKRPPYQPGMYLSRLTPPLTSLSPRELEQAKSQAAKYLR